MEQFRVKIVFFVGLVVLVPVTFDRTQEVGYKGLQIHKNRLIETHRKLLNCAD